MNGCWLLQPTAIAAPLAPAAAALQGCTRIVVHAQEVASNPADWAALLDFGTLSAATLRCSCARQLQPHNRFTSDVAPSTFDHLLRHTAAHRPHTHAHQVTPGSVPAFACQGPPSGRWETFPTLTCRTWVSRSRKAVSGEFCKASPAGPGSPGRGRRPRPPPQRCRPRSTGRSAL